MKFKIFTIYYDQSSYEKVPPGFIPLANPTNRNGWFEFFPILEFLKTHKLDDGIWYGFLSPRFLEKTGYDNQIIFDILNHIDQYSDVALFSPAWDQIAYFLNPWEQGEIWHPGLMYHSQQFLNQINFNIDLEASVTDSTSTVYSNYIIAKKNYWEKWKEIALKFYEYVESANSQLATIRVSYGSVKNQYPMKSFIQERLASLILLTNSFSVITPDQSTSKPIFTRLFQDDSNTRHHLIAMDTLKKLYRKNSNQDTLKSYWMLRNEIKFTKP